MVSFRIGVNRRIQTILAEAGIASRRESERIIRAGRVTVNGQRVTQLGSKADPERDRISVDGTLVSPAPPKRYLVLNKPAGYVTTRFDPRGRPVVFDLLSPQPVRLFSVGRLDYWTEGLLLLTNDGALAHRLMHPSFGLERVYEAQVAGRLSDETLRMMRKGVMLEDGIAIPLAIELLSREKDQSLLKLTLGEGRYREVRRICQAMGHKVLRLRRVQFGPLRLRGLAPGQSRALTPRELDQLRAAISGSSDRRVTPRTER
jgi:pseudouridine synthase